MGAENCRHGRQQAGLGRAELAPFTMVEGRQPTDNIIPFGEWNNDRLTNVCNRAVAKALAVGIERNRLGGLSGAKSLDQLRELVRIDAKLAELQENWLASQRARDLATALGRRRQFQHKSLGRNGLGQPF